MCPLNATYEANLANYLNMYSNIFSVVDDVLLERESTIIAEI